MKRRLFSPRRAEMVWRTAPAIVLVGLLLSTAAFAAGAPDPLERNFLAPPSSAKPWVYWFPLDGNITRDGTTADLEAMARVGIGGVLYMETEQGTPGGPRVPAGRTRHQRYDPARPGRSQMGGQ
jgi:hypothetical protein